MNYLTPELLTSLGTFIGVIAAAILGIITAMKTTTVSKKVDVVHEQTNSYLTRLETQLQVSNASLAGAILEIKNAEVARVKLASEAAATLRDTPVAAAPQVIVVSEKGQVIG